MPLTSISIDFNVDCNKKHIKNITLKKSQYNWYNSKVRDKDNQN